MKTLAYILLCQILFLFHFVSTAQTTGEWLVDMDTHTGAFQPVGPILDGIEVICVGLQTKDETNGQYIFLGFDPSDFVFVDISNAEIVQQIPFTLFSYQIFGFYCLDNCDNLVLICVENVGEYSFLVHLNRYDAELTAIGDSLPNENTGPFQNGPLQAHAFDPNTNRLYLYSDYNSTLRVVDAMTGNVLDTFPVSGDPSFMAYDEINNALYGIETVNFASFKLLRFDAASEDFVQIGQPFSTQSTGYMQPSIDGNTQRLFITRSGSSYGSFMMSVDILTGQLLADVQTMPPYLESGLFGGPNALNGQYFNTTNQLITLHWGDEIDTQTDIPENDPDFKASLYPNPNQGIFKLEMNSDGSHLVDVHIWNDKGQLMYKGKNVHGVQSIYTHLSAGHYVANILDAGGKVIEKIPFIVAGR